MGTGPAAMFSVEVRGQVAVVQMAHGKANALDTAFCRSLIAEFGEFAGRGCRAAVPHRPWVHLLGGCRSAAAARWRPRLPR